MTSIRGDSAMRLFALLVMVLGLFGTFAACDDNDPRKAPDGYEAKVDMDADSTEILARPDVKDRSVEVEHILIAFKGSERSTASRSKDEAEKLAKDLYAKIKAGEDFDALKTKHTDDSGQKDADKTYVMYDSAKGGSKADGEFSRANMAKGFGDVSWRLKVGEVGVSPYKQGYSDFGWHIIRRVK
ncbi:MAG: peptidylprolyl isomerase [Planctomycetes bacterium]|nr:peptidylprolyl isomerase [Planctomycetota bacterium]